MEKRYLVTSNYIDKKTGETVSTIAPINAGVGKTGSPYAFIDMERKETISGTYELGTTLVATLSFSAQADKDNSQEQRLKLGTK